MQADFLVHHELMTAPGASPGRWMLVLHGLLGSGSNLRSFVRRLAAACPSWGFALVDLRAHGQSTGAPPPHTLRAAAEDLVRLDAVLPGVTRGVLGHSLGGKVALAFAELAPARLDQVWVLDAQPGARVKEGGTAAVIHMLRAMPEVVPSRERFVEIVESHGYDDAFAAWLSMNLRHDEDGLRLRVDMSAIEALFESYCATELWGAVTAPDRARELHVVIGGDSPVLSEEDRALLAEIAAASPHVRVHTLQGAGHWVHVDDPDGLLRLVSEALCASPQAG